MSASTNRTYTEPSVKSHKEENMRNIKINLYSVTCIECAMVLVSRKTCFEDEIWLFVLYSYTRQMTFISAVEYYLLSEVILPFIANEGQYAGTYVCFRKERDQLYKQ